MSHLLVVAHEATRTGAPRVLLQLLRDLPRRAEVTCTVRVLKGGPLERELTALSHADERAPDAALVNSALAAAELWALPPALPAAVYVHEQGDTLAGLPDEAHRALVERAALLLAPSEGTVEDLVGLGVDRRQIRVLPPVVTTSPLTDEEIERARAAMGARPGEPLVVACGEATWRKGADLFLATLAHVREHRAVHAAWIGRRFATDERRLDLDEALWRLDPPVRWIGEVADATAHLAAADLLVMTSREDPQPLVPIEAAAAGVATCGFAVGGLVDLSDAGAAATVPYPDTVALADLILHLLDDPGARGRLAAAARDRLAHRQSIEVVGPAFAAAVEDLVAGAG